MSKTIQEQIEVMQHFVNGGKIETKAFHNSDWIGVDFPKWDWSIQDYRIKEQKKNITIEKWLLKTYSESRYDIAETSNITDYVMGCIGWEKVKLLETYEVEL